MTDHEMNILLKEAQEKLLTKNLAEKRRNENFLIECYIEIFKIISQLEHSSDPFEIFNTSKEIMSLIREEVKKE